ncbi:cytochrome c biogenesis CcdA family protein [soil metagenome]
MIDAGLAVAFASGMVASVNPCGFAMLPAYLAWFVGDADTERSIVASLLRALVVGAIVAVAFVLVFGLAGLLFTELSLSVSRYTPWVTTTVGAALVVLGGAMLAGYEPKVSLPRLERGTGGRGLGSMFLFGVSYAVASLSCTLPIFIANVTNTFSRSNFVSGLSVFLAYALGMGLVLMVVTVAVALARNSLVSNIRRVLPHVNRISGALLVVAGAYVAGYGIYEIRLGRDPSTGAGIFASVSDLSADLSAWVQDTGPTRIGLALAIVALSIVLVALLRPDTDRSQ